MNNRQDSHENIPRDNSISCVKTWFSSEIISDMIQLIKACMVSTVSLEEIILHTKIRNHYDECLNITLHVNGSAS